MPIVVDVVNNSGLDWAAIAAAGATVVAAVGGIWGTSRQAKHAREAASQDLAKSIAAAQEDLRLNIIAENERVRLVEERQSYDSAQQRITELYSKAVEQLGHEKAPVRLGGFYALERLAQDNPGQRQTVADVVCAYLRMPFSPDIYPDTPKSDSQNYQELQVRLAAQGLLIRHLEIPMVPSEEEGIALAQPDEPPASYWEGMTINLSGAQLFDIDLTLCVLDGDIDFSRAQFGGQARFGRTRFEGICSFDDARFYRDARFGYSAFNTDASFERTEFLQNTDFSHAWFGMHGRFTEAKFRGSASFDQSEFTMGALFSNAIFYTDAHFRNVKFGGPNTFEDAQFNGENPDFSGSTVHKLKYRQDWPPKWKIEPPVDAKEFSKLILHTDG